MGNHVASDAVVSTDWLADRLDDVRSPASDLRVLEVGTETDPYAAGHVPGAVGWRWGDQLQGDDGRDLPLPERFAAECEAAGVDRETTVVVYGHSRNWAAAFACWTFRYYGHDDVRLLDGGRERWIAEGRPTTVDPPDHPPTDYALDVDEARWSVRAYAEDVRRAVERDATVLDVRTRDEFVGERVSPQGYEERALVGGRVPGAVHLPWDDLLTDEGVFAPEHELRDALRAVGVDVDAHENGRADDPLVVYCRLGKRSAVVWHALTRILEFDAVANYDGSWTEWGNLVGAPVASGPKCSGAE